MTTTTTPPPTSTTSSTTTAPLSAPGALAAAWTSHGHMVVRRARALLGNDDDARDLAQEVFASLVARPEQFSGRSAVSTFLYAATTNLCLRRLRDGTRRRQLVALFVAPQQRDAQAGPAGEHLAVLRDVLSRVPFELAQVATCIYLDEMTHDEVAEVLGVSRRTVGNLLVRFHDKVKRILRPDEARAFAAVGITRHHEEPG